MEQGEPDGICPRDNQVRGPGADEDTDTHGSAAVDERVSIAQASFDGGY